MSHRRTFPKRTSLGPGEPLNHEYMIKLPGGLKLSDLPHSMRTNFKAWMERHIKTKNLNEGYGCINLLDFVEEADLPDNVRNKVRSQIMSAYAQDRLDAWASEDDLLAEAEEKWQQYETLLELSELRMRRALNLFRDREDPDQRPQDLEQMRLEPTEHWRTWFDPEKPVTWLEALQIHLEMRHDWAICTMHRVQNANSRREQLQKQLDTATGRVEKSIAVASAEHRKARLKLQPKVDRWKDRMRAMHEEMSDLQQALSEFKAISDYPLKPDAQANALGSKIAALVRDAEEADRARQMFMALARKYQNSKQKFVAMVTAEMAAVHSTWDKLRNLSDSVQEVVADRAAKAEELEGRFDATLIGFKQAPLDELVSIYDTGRPDARAVKES